MPRLQSKWVRPACKPDVIHTHIHYSHSLALARLLGTATAAATTTTAQAVLEDAGNNAATTAGGGTTAVSVTPVKNDNKAGGTTGEFPLEYL